MSEVPSNLSCEFASAEDALSVSDLPTGIAPADDAAIKKMTLMDSVMFQARFIETEWLNARVLGLHEDHVVVQVRDLPGQEIVVNLPYDAIAAVTKDH